VYARWLFLALRTSQDVVKPKFGETPLLGDPMNTCSLRALLKGTMSASVPLKVILVEDHVSFRQVLAFLLSDDPGLEVVAQVGSLAQAREALDGGLDGTLDVAVLDLELPDGDARELIGELRRSSPGIRIVVLSATVRAEHAEEVRRSGADVVLDKVRSYQTIAEELRRMSGR
jgi:DNA-binding NarL/FixJ family response regulator